MNVREAISSDAEAIHHLISEVAPSCHQDFGPRGLVNFITSNTLEKILERIQSRDYLSLLCEIENKVIGIITVKNYEKIDQLFVHPKYWRRGIARNLWQKAFVILKKNAQVSVITVKSSSVGVQVYKCFGFAVAGAKGSSGHI